MDIMPTELITSERRVRPSEAMATRKLQEFVYTSEDCLSRDGILPFSSLRGFFDAYPRTPHFKELGEEFLRTLLCPASYNSLNTLTSRFAGAVFQDFAASFVAECVNKSLEDQIFLTATPVLEFFHYIYPDKPLIPDHFGQDSLRGISVPDGLIVSVEKHSQPRVVACLEATLVTDYLDYYLQRKMKAREGSIRRYPGLFPEDTKVILVSPATDRTINKDHVIHLRLPYSTIQLGLEITKLMKNYPEDVESPTICDFLDRAFTQLNRLEEHLLVLGNDFGLPLEEVDYLRRAGYSVSSELVRRYEEGNWIGRN